MRENTITLASLYNAGPAQGQAQAQGAQTSAAASGTTGILPDYNLFGVVLGTMAVQKFPDADISNIDLVSIRNHCRLAYGFAKLGYQTWIEGENPSNVQAFERVKKAV